MFDSMRIPNNISFRVETMFSAKGGVVGRIKPNELGVYQGLPMMVLGETTQQQTYYDPKSVVEQITNPNTKLNKVLTQGKLYGEWGHPRFYGLKDEEKIERLLDVIEDRYSHAFKNIYTDKTSADGLTVVRADIKPTGPFGEYLKESLEDPTSNPAFSLRAFVKTDVKPNGLKYRTVRQLVTWDSVGASGYFSTDKAHAIGLESMAGEDYHEYEISLVENGDLMIDQIALETFSNTDLNEIFGIANLSQLVQTRTFVKPDPDLISRFPNLYPNALFNEFFKEG